MEVNKGFLVYFSWLVVGFFSLKTNGFSFNVKSAGAVKVTATPGNVIRYNAHLVVTENTTLSFHVSLPYFQTPILNVETIKVVGKGKNLEITQQLYSYGKEDENSLDSRSQSSIDFGQVTWKDGSQKPGDDLVVQVQARLLDHVNVTAGKVFWLYFGMQYLNDAVWVIGKSIKADLQSGPADIAASLKIPDGIPLSMRVFKFEIDIYHKPNSRGSASSLTITLSTPSTLTMPVANTAGPAPAFDLSTSGGINITFTEPLELGQRVKIVIQMTYDGSEKGKFVHGNIYGGFQYQTDPDGSGPCTDPQTIEKKENLQLAFKFYAELDSCDNMLGIAGITHASSAKLPCCPSEYVRDAASTVDLHWEAWKDGNGVRTAEEYIQFDFTKKTTVRRINTLGFVKTKQFVRSYYVLYSQDGAHWKYVTEMGKKKEFEANTNAVDYVMNILPNPLTVWFLRIRVVKRSPSGASMKVTIYGCEDATATKPYEAYQRGFLAVPSILILCNVYPDRSPAKPNCYLSPDEGSKWNEMHPSVVNVIGYSATSGKTYALGVTSIDAPVYMEVTSAQSVRVISESDWNTAKTSCTLPTVIPLYPVHGNPLFQLNNTSVTVGTITYVGSPEGLLKDESGEVRMIASWSKFITE